MLTGNAKVHDPQESKEVDPSHAEQEGVLRVCNETGGVMLGGVAGRLQDEKAGSPAGQGHGQGKKRLKKTRLKYKTSTATFGWH